MPQVLRTTPNVDNKESFRFWFLVSQRLGLNRDLLGVTCTLTYIPSPSTQKSFWRFVSFHQDRKECGTRLSARKRAWASGVIFLG